YWDMAIRQSIAPGDLKLRAEAETRRDRASQWVRRLPEKSKQPANPSYWFAVGPPVGTPAICKRLEGEGAAGVDAAGAAVPLHRPVVHGNADVLLFGDGHAVAIQWPIADGGSVLVLASGSFLLNLALANPARRPLAEETANWIGHQPKR